MSNVFLDVNVILDLLEQRTSVNPDDLTHHTSWASPLSCHIAAYTYKLKMPNLKLANFFSKLSLTPFDQNILEQALTSPTSDLEDNIRLHSAVAADCDFFLTTDKQLLNLAYFGRLKLASRITSA